MKQEELRKLVTYDGSTGEFHTINGGGMKRPGEKIGYIEKKSGRIRISFWSVQYFAHRLAWIYEYGDIPDGLMIDHIDGDRQNNRIANLRLVTHSENMQNIHCPPKNKHGLRGVQFCKHKKKFRAVIRVNDVRKHLGYFDCADKAHAAYLEAKKVLHPFSSPEARRKGT